MIYYIDTFRSEIWNTGLSCRLSRPAMVSIIGHLKRIEKNSGAKMLVSTLKDLIVWIRQPDLCPYRRHKNGSWYGPFKPLWELSQRGRRGLICSLRFLKIYGFFTAPEPTLKEYKLESERLANLTDPFKIRDIKVEVSPLVTEIASSVSVRIGTSYFMSPKRAPITKDGRTVAENQMIPEDHIESLTMFPKLVRRHYGYFKFLVGDDLPPPSYYHELCGNPTEGEIKHDVAGRVSILTKDRGLKLRLIANANRMLQLACTPLHNFLKEVLKRQPQCFCFNQEDGSGWVTEQFRHEHALSSIDLKAASDNIPLSVQYAFARNLFRRESLLEASLFIFREASRMVWVSPYPGVTLTWKKGTPMGLRGSYYLFTLWLINEFELIGMTGAYAIVGDDIVIHSQWTEKVISLFERCKVPVSVAKSILHSYQFAEFCGRIIDKKGSLPVFKGAPYKKEDPIGKLRQLGLRALRFFPALAHLNRRDKRYLKAVYWLTKGDRSSVFRQIAKPRPPQLVNPGGFTLKQLQRLGLIKDEHYPILSGLFKLAAAKFEESLWTEFILSNTQSIQEICTEVSLWTGRAVVPPTQTSYQVLFGIKPKRRWRVNPKPFYQKVLDGYNRMALDADLMSSRKSIDKFLVPYNSETLVYTINRLETGLSSDSQSWEYILFNGVRLENLRKSLDVDATDVFASESSTRQEWEAYNEFIPDEEKFRKEFGTPKLPMSMIRKIGREVISKFEKIIGLLSYR